MFAQDRRFTVWQLFSFFFPCLIRYGVELLFEYSVSTRLPKLSTEARLRKHFQIILVSEWIGELIFWNIRLQSCPFPASAKNMIKWSDAASFAHHFHCITNQIEIAFNLRRLQSPER